VLLVLWLPAGLEVVRPGQSNVAKIAEFYSESHPGADVRDGVRVTANQLAATPDWVVWPNRIDFTAGVDLVGPLPIPWVLVPFVAALIVAWRRRLRTHLWLAGIVTAGLVASVIAISNVSGPLYDYLVRWTCAMGAAVWVFVAAVLVVCIPRRLGPPAFAMLVVAVCAVALVGALRVRNEFDAKSPEAALVPQVAMDIQKVLDEREPVLVRPFGDIEDFASVALQLERRGVEVAVDPPNARAWGRHRAARAPNAQATVLIGGSNGRTEAPEGRVVGRASVRPPEEREDALRQAERLERLYRSGAFDSAEYLRRVQSLPQPGRELLAVIPPPERP
jgi:hypothetical protein